MTLPLHPDLPNLERHYDQEVLPVLLTLEQQRNARSRLAYIGIAICIVIGCLWAWHLSRANSRLTWVHALVITLGASYATRALFLSSVGKRAKAVFVRGLVEGAMGWQFSDKGYAPRIFDTLKDLGFFKLHTRSEFSDNIRGKVLGSAFDLMELKLERQNGKRSTTVFRGMLLGIDATTPFTGTIIARRKKLGPLKSQVKLKPVGLASPSFNAQFNVFGDDQVTARELLSPTFMTQLIELEAAFKGKNLQLAFMQGRVFIVMETHDQFEIKNLSKTLLDRSRFELLQSEINAIYHLAEGLKPKSAKAWREAFE